MALFVLLVGLTFGLVLSVLSKKGTIESKIVILKSALISFVIAVILLIFILIFVGGEVAL